METMIPGPRITLVWELPTVEVTMGLQISPKLLLVEPLFLKLDFYIRWVDRAVESHAHEFPYQREWGRSESGREFG